MIEFCFRRIWFCKRVHLPTDRETGRLRGFGFVEMGTDAEEQLPLMDLMVLSGWGVPKVNKAKPKEDNRGSSFGGGGGRENSSFSNRY